MRHTDKMRMGLALAGLVFCFTSAAQILVRHPDDKQGLSAATTTASVRSVSASSGDTHLPEKIEERLKQDSWMQWISVESGPSIHAHKMIAKTDNPALFTAITGAIGHAHPGSATHQPIQHLIVFYRRDGSMDWVAEVASDSTLFDPVSHRYLHPSSNIIKLVSRGRLT